MIGIPSGCCIKPNLNHYKAHKESDTHLLGHTIIECEWSQRSEEYVEELKKNKYIRWNVKYLLFIHLILARDLNYIAIVQVFCYSLKKEWNVTYIMTGGKVVPIRDYFFIESRLEMRGIVGIGQMDIKSNSKTRGDCFWVILYDNC